MSWGNGTLTPLATAGTPSITSSKLRIPDNSSWVAYTGTSNFDSAQTGAFRCLFTPGFSGNPGSRVDIISIGTNVNNSLFYLFIGATGGIGLTVQNSAGSSIINASVQGSYAPVSGTEVEIEVDFDFTSGATRIFLNGVQQGSTFNNTFTRSSANIISATVGPRYFGQLGNFSIRNMEFFSAVQHTADYTPGYTVPASDYITSYVDFPAITKSLGFVSFDSFTDTEAGTVLYVINGKYWNGSAWVTSDKSVAQANTKAVVNTNIPTLSATGVTSSTITVVFSNTNTQSTVSSLTYNFHDNQYYSTGSILTNVSLEMMDGDSFSTVSSAPTSTQLGYILVVNNVNKYFVGTTLTTSDGTIAQSNTEAVLNTNMPNLNFSPDQNVQLLVLFATSDNQATATITTATVVYEFGGTITPPTTCLVWGYYYDVTGTPVEGATVSFFLKRKAGQYKAVTVGAIIEKSIDVVTDVNGYFETNLIRSSQYQGSGTYEITITLSPSLNTSINFNGTPLTYTVPNQATQNITGLLTAS